MIVIAFMVGLVAGYFVCLFGTWVRVNRQVSDIRALSRDIGIAIDLGEEVPPEWVRSRLATMIAKEYS